MDEQIDECADNRNRDLALFETQSVELGPQERTSLNTVANAKRDEYVWNSLIFRILMPFPRRSIVIPSVSVKAKNAKQAVLGTKIQAVHAQLHIELLNFSDSYHHSSNHVQTA